MVAPEANDFMYIVAPIKASPLAASLIYPLNVNLGCAKADMLAKSKKKQRNFIRIVKNRKDGKIGK